MPNRLAHETSPYLLQHAENPVDWYPWGPEALERARREGKPIFLSIGYSSCHWCHVMERESFEDERIARLLNEHFVAIKVDREERPDLDETYMKAVQALSGQGGWPMSVFLTPDLEPFFGGTYFPPRGAFGRPGFGDVLLTLARAWETQREKVVEQAGRLAEAIRAEARADTRGELAPDVLDRSLAALRESFDPVHGGFGGAPKFPHALDLRLLLRHALRTGAEEPRAMASLSLDRMARGGIYDQLAGGFHRYSVDEEWCVPHFEKMLYDNALLVPAYLEGFLATGEPSFARIARECCEWMLGEMALPEGAFAGSQDADSEGEEGRYFVWTESELVSVLGRERGRRAAVWFDVTPEGTFEHGTSVLRRRRSAEELAEELGVPARDLVREMEGARAELLAARRRRVAPATDDKVITAWNGLALSALAQAAQVLDEPRYATAARRAARFLLERLRREDGRLLATWRAGRAHVPGYLDDHAFVVQGLLDLYETDFDPAWIEEALALDAVLERDFEDPERGGWFTTAADHEAPIARLRSPHDGALPSGAAVHALNLLRLAELTGRGPLARRAERAITSLGGLANRYPQAFSQLLLAADFLAGPPREVVIAGEDGPAAEALLTALRRRFRPQRVVARAVPGVDHGVVGLAEGREAPPAGQARAYVCLHWACRAPVETPEALVAALEDA